jgi:hypothetical protein
MSMRMISLVLLIGAFVTACQSQQANEFSGDAYGAGIQSEEYTDVGEMLHTLATEDTVETTVLATVDQVCQAKGCWMTLVTPDDSEMMVKFKDYGFFVPKDISGRQILIEGVAYTTVVSVDELRHYAEDAGKSREEIEKITEPDRQKAFLATGVLVLDK